MRTPRHTWVAILAGVLTPFAGVSGQQEIFETGNRLYQEENYSGAIEAYEGVLAAGYESADLYYNLGNAYFKSGSLGESVLAWERALVLAPGNDDILFNLEIANSIKTDVIEPLPRFWLFDAIRWWVDLIPRGALVLLVTVAWLATVGALLFRVLARDGEGRWLAGWIATAGAVVVVLFGANLAVRELRLGQPERGVILAEAVPVRSAPAEEDDLTLFEVHEGTRVRIDQRTGEWAEVVLDDGKVGWVPADVMGVI